MGDDNRQAGALTLLDRYRQALEETVSTIRLFDDDNLHPLEEVFVDLSIIEEYRPPTDHAEFLSLINSRLQRQDAQREAPRNDAFDTTDARRLSTKRLIKSADLLRQRRQAIISGLPGSGKTTLLRYLASQVLKEDRRLPVFLELKIITRKDFEQARYDLAELLFAKGVKALVNAPGDRLKTSAVKELKAAFVARLQAGEVVVFLDGLDEVSGQKGVIQHLCQSVKQFVAATSKENSVVISTRPYALKESFDGLEKMEIEPLNRQQIEALLRRYYAADAEVILKALRGRDDLRDLTESPFLLGVIAGLYRSNRQLVENRLTLYEQIVVRLADKRDCEKSLPTDRFLISDEGNTLKLDFLKWFACERLLVDKVKRRGVTEEASRLVFARDEVVRKAKEFIKLNQLSGVANLSPHNLASDVIVTPLLREVGLETYAFVHLTIGEYLAAKSLAERDAEERRKLFFRAYFNTTLAEMEVLPMTLGLVADADADELYGEFARLPESLTHTGLRLRLRGLSMGAEIAETEVKKLSARLLEFIRRERDEESPFAEQVIRSLASAPFAAVEYIVQQVVELLRHEAAYVRESAAEALGAIGAERGVDGLLAVLLDKDEDASVRESAAEALGAIGAERGVDGLLAALKDEDADVRWRAASALGAIGSERAVDGLLAVVLDKDEDADVRGRAASVLGAIKDERAVDGLLAVLLDKDEAASVRWSAASALGAIGSERAVESLLAVVLDKDEDADVRWRAASALGAIGAERSVDGLLAALKDEDASVRWSAASALGAIGSERAVDGLLAVLKDEDAYVRWRAASALGAIGSERAVDGLLAVLLDKDEAASVRWSAASALGAIGSERAVESLLAVLKDEAAYVRGRAAEALGAIGAERGVDGLLAALKDEDAYVRWSAAEALGAIGAERGVDGLLAVLLDKDEDADVRWRAASALGAIGAERGVDGLLAALKDEDADVRWSAAEALAKLSVVVLANGLQRALASESDVVRRKAVELSGYYLSDEPTLREISRLAVNDPVDGVRQVATQAKEKFIRKLEVLGIAVAVEDSLSTVAPSLIEERERRIRSKYAEVLAGGNAQQKGRALEELVAALFASIEGFQVTSRNLNTETEEIDIVIRNESRDAFWMKEGSTILVECKHWHSQRVGKNEFGGFKRKMKYRRKRCHLGFLICTETFADTIVKEMLRESKSQLLVVPLDGEDLRRLVEAENRNELVKMFVERATMV